MKKETIKQQMYNLVPAVCDAIGGHTSVFPRYDGMGLGIPYARCPYMVVRKYDRTPMIKVSVGIYCFNNYRTFIIRYVDKTLPEVCKILADWFVSVDHKSNVNQLEKFLKETFGTDMRITDQGLS